MQSIINQLYSDMLFNRNDCSYKTEKKLDETLRIIRRVFSCHLQWCYSEHNMMKTWIRVLQKSNEREKDPVPHIHFFNFVHGSCPSMVRPKFGHYSSMVNSLHLNPQKGRYNVFAATNATRIYSQLSTWAPKSCWRIKKSKLPAIGIQLPVTFTGSKSLTIWFRK